MRCALLPPFPFFIATGLPRSNIQGTIQRRGAWQRGRWVEFNMHTQAACGIMRVGRLGISQFIYEPVVLPIPAAAPAPSGCGDEDHGIAHLAVYCSLLALFITSPQAPEHTSRTVRAHSTMRAGCLGISEFIYESGVLPALAAAPAPLHPKLACAC